MLMLALVSAGSWLLFLPKSLTIILFAKEVCVSRKGVYSWMGQWVWLLGVTPTLLGSNARGHSRTYWPHNAFYFRNPGIPERPAVLHSYFGYPKGFFLKLSMLWHFSAVKFTKLGSTLGLVASSSSTMSANVRNSWILYRFNPICHSRNMTPPSGRLWKHRLCHCNETKWHVS